MKTPLKILLDKKGHFVHSAAPRDTVADAVHRMNEHRVGAVLVLENGRPIGIFTERDVLRAVVGADIDPATATIGEHMTRDLIVVSPSCTVEEAMRVITSKRCRHLPVMDGEELIGLISIGDLLSWITRSQEDAIDNLIRYIRGEYQLS